MSSPTHSSGDEPRFSTDAARAVFRRAAEHQEMARATLDANAGDLTLSDLQAIGAEAGIAPAYVAAAAAELESPDTTEDAPWWYSGPTEIKAEAVVPGTITDGPVWAAMVRALRNELGGNGTVTQLDTTLEWSIDRNGQTVRVTATPEAHGTRIRIAQSTKEMARVIPILSGTFGITSLLLAILYAAGGFEPDVAMLPVIFGAIALLVFAAGTPAFRSHLRKQQRQLDRMLDRLELIALKQMASPVEEAAQAESSMRSELTFDQPPTEDAESVQSARQRSRS
jgi:hypothetical protein